MKPYSELNIYPPPINEEEKNLSREERVHLSRHRCGHYSLIHSCTHRINLTDSDTCTLCSNAQVSLEHIILQGPHLQSHGD